NLLTAHVHAEARRGASPSPPTVALRHSGPFQLEQVQPPHKSPHRKGALYKLALLPAEPAEEVPGVARPAPATSCCPRRVDIAPHTLESSTVLRRRPRP